MKTCNKCGNSNADEAVFCASCGAPLDQAPQAAPEQPSYTAPAYETPAYSAPAASAVPAEKNKATLWLILNIVAIVVCCPGSFLFSAIGIVFAAIGMGSYKKGDYEDMSKKAKISMIMFIIGVVLGVLGLVLSFLGMFTLPFISEFSSYN